MKDIKQFENKILLGDCIKTMKKLPSGSIDLIFADPPYNIGVSYDIHKDKMKYESYISWTEEWITECIRLLSDKGSIYIAINDEHVAEVVMFLKKKGLVLRNWIIWYYTFGQAQKKKFSRSHTHLVYFVKEKNNFMFNSDKIRIPSVRQKIGDKRANPKGKIPDDVWVISRVAGTFNERVKNFPCQMPVKLLERVIKASSSTDSVILDPFAGSGTTPFVAKKLGRKYIGIEISEKYKEMIENRLKEIL